MSEPFLAQVELKLRPPIRKEEERTHPFIPKEARDERVGQPRREKREESFMPVEITCAWVRAEKGIGGRIVLGVVCAGAEAPAS
jgi:hypothetical protein